MSRAPLQISVVISSANHADTLPALLDSVLNQTDASIECRVVDTGSTDGSSAILAHYAPRLASVATVSKAEEVPALNHAFAQMQGDVFLWLDGGDRLTPWAFRLVSFVLTKLDTIQWLTSATPVVWTRADLCLTAGLADGYSRELFQMGRNLATSSYFQNPIWRNGTYWTRALWDKAGKHIALPLDEAGDFELWQRFWMHSTLTALYLPLAGRQLAARPATDERYWHSAAQLLHAGDTQRAPSALERALKRFLIRRMPSLRTRWASPAPRIWIAPPTQDCGISTAYVL